MAVYQGRDSNYAKVFGLYVKRLRRPGVDTLKEALALATMVCFDYKRGITVDNDAPRKIRMTRSLFEQRLRFIKRLQIYHDAPEAVREKTDRIIDFCLKHRRPPKRIEWHGRRYSVKGIVRKMLVAVNDEGEKLKEKVLSFAG